MTEDLKFAISARFKNTELGFLRIQKNLCITEFSNKETENYLKKVILATPLENIETKGKNHYFFCSAYNAILTINAHSFTVITAKQIKKKSELSLKNLK